MEEISGMQRLTDNAKKIIIKAAEYARTYRSNEVEIIHVFLALISEPSGFVLRIFDKAGLDIESTRAQIIKEINLRSSIIGTTGEPKFSTELKDLINRSFLIAENLSHVYVGSEHLLIGILDHKHERFVQELNEVGLTPQVVTQLALDLGSYMPGILSQTREPGFDLESEKEGGLPFFSKDMNKQAEDGEFLNITGRDEEINRLIHILSRKTKNNPILVGDAGVGKTAVVQGLAQKIVAEQVPPSFLDKKVISLDVASIVAGARIRGDVEERILGVVNDAIESGDKIIFIDEIHMIIGAGGYGGGGSMDIANILKPYLTDPNLRVIGATTMTEYRRFFDDDPALSRRFQPIEVPELDQKSALEILKNIKVDFEKYHGVKIRDDALTEAVEMSSKFITDRYLPDKAIDLIDEAAASVKIGREVQIEPQLSELGDKLVSIQKKKEAALEDEDLQAAATQRQAETEITEQIEELLEGGKSAKTPVKDKVVDANLIRKIVVDWTKIPLAAADINQTKLKELGHRIAKRIIGEDQVLEVVVEALKRSHLGLIDSKRPLASFLFLGPTGVGKTELAKTIAAELFGSSDLLVQINMSEYMEMHSVAKLIGSPPGYVGYQEGGQLTEDIRRRPYSVVLFDEIEKAHPEVLNLLLQILEEGELKDGRGRRAVFANTVVILTSNIGAEEVSKDRHLGFDVANEDLKSPEMDRAYQDMRNNLLDILKQNVRPELLNRLDGIGVFRGLNKDDCYKITQVQVDDLVVQLLNKGIVLEVAKPVIGYINEQGYSKEYGARNIRRKIQEVIENGLADYMLTNKVKRSRKQLVNINVKLDKDNKVVFTKS